jgi:hypothetical protein
MSSPSAPAPPDPYKTASAEGQSNIQTALANQTLGNPNVVGPTGSTTYSPSGQFETITMPDGSTQQIQRQTQTTSLSAPEQKIYDLNAQARTNVGQIGVDQSARIGDLLGKPVDYSDLKLDPNSFGADRQRVEQAMYQRMQPQLDRTRDAEENRLVNQGFQRGTQAFTDAMGDVGRQENDLRLGITAAGLGEQQGMYGMARDAAGYEMSRRAGERNAPINEITALMSGSQVSAPSTPGYNAPTVAGTNIGQNVYGSAAMQQQQYQAEMAKQNAMMGGVAGLAGAGAYGVMGPGAFAKKLWGG